MININKDIEKETEKKKSKETKGLNKTLLIVAIVIVTVLGLGFVAIRVLGNTILSRILSRNTNGNVEVENGGKKVTYSGKEGEFSYDETGKLPEGFPNDFPIYPGASLTNAWSAKGTNSEGTSVVWESSDTVEKVSEFFKNDLEQKGWKVNATFVQADSATFSFENDKFNGFVGITKKDDKAVISVTIGGKQP